MPLLKRKPVPLAPLPASVQDGSLPDDTPVYYLHATGEIFLDYEAYAERIGFYLQRIFTCEATGRQGLDYYSAMNSELKESTSVHQRFPPALKPKVLASAHYSMIGRLDTLVDRIYDRFKDRYFFQEICHVAPQPGDTQKYLGRVVAIDPPHSVKDLLLRNPSYLASCAQAGVDPNQPSPDMFFTASHQIAGDLNNVDDDVVRWDPPDQYTYFVELLGPDETPLDAQPIPVPGQHLMRDRTIYTKTFVKRYLKECLTREHPNNCPWVVKKRYAIEFGLPLEPPDEIKAMNAEKDAAAAAKRRKGKSGGADEPPYKKHKGDAPALSQTASDEQGKPKAKPVKYPIEDLALDPTSIFDGRLLRRQNAETPPLPQKPLFSRELPVEKQHFPTFSFVWSMLNIFGWPLGLSNFTMDQFAQVLSHSSIDAHCELLVEIHGALLSIIGVEGCRLSGCSTTTSTGPMPAFPPCEPGTEEAEMSDEQKERIIRSSLRFARKWDRSKRLHVDKKRKGWMRHLIGCLGQRGGVDMLPQLPRLFKHLLADYLQDIQATDDAAAGAPSETPDPTVEESDKPDNGMSSPLTEPAAGSPAKPDPPAASADPDQEIDELDEDGEIETETRQRQSDRKEEEEAQEEEPEEEDEEFEDAEDPAGPQQQYLTLSVGDKLAILEFLCTVITNSKPYRFYIEDCETALTDFRKKRIDMNKERRALQAEKAALAQQSKEKDEKSTLAVPGQQQDDGDAGASAGDSSSRAPTPSAATNGRSASPAGSDVDELASESGSHQETGNEKATSRQAAMREKNLHKQAAKSPKGKLAAKAAEAKAAAKPLVKDDKYFEEALAAIDEVEEGVEREFRRHQNVIRIRPLGRDRFFCSYWYMDGIGTMELLNEDDGTPEYGTGRIFVQGPSAPDSVFALSLASLESPAQLKERRLKEEGSSDALVETGDWAVIHTEAELDALMSWLNPKGNREHALRQTITDLRPYIVAGMKKRAHDMQLDEGVKEEAPSKSRRTSKGRQAPKRTAPHQLYMTYVNEFAWQNAKKTRPKDW